MPTPINKADNSKIDKINYSNQRLFANNSNSYTKNKFVIEHLPLIEENVEKPNVPLLITEKITMSKYILDLKYNWDEDGAKAISKNAYSNATEFLISYAERIVDVYGDDKDHLLAPSISPVKDGSVDLEWNLTNSYLLINFTDSKEDFVYYYLAFKDGDKITFDANGQVERKKINDKFASYLISLS